MDLRGLAVIAAELSDAIRDRQSTPGAPVPPHLIANGSILVSMIHASTISTMGFASEAAGYLKVVDEVYGSVTVNERRRALMEAYQETQKLEGYRSLPNIRGGVHDQLHEFYRRIGATAIED